MRPCFVPCFVPCADQVKPLLLYKIRLKSAYFWVLALLFWPQKRYAKRWKHLFLQRLSLESSRLTWSDLGTMLWLGIPLKLKSYYVIEPGHYWGYLYEQLQYCKRYKLYRKPQAERVYLGNHMRFLCHQSAHCNYMDWVFCCRVDNIIGINLSLFTYNGT